VTHYIEGGLLIHDGRAAAAFRLELRREELLSIDEWEHQVQREVSRLAALSGRDCQLLGVYRSWGIFGWIERLEHVTPHPNRGFPDALQTTVDRLGGAAGGRRKEVYLLVSLTASKPHQGLDRIRAGLRALGRSADRLTSLQDPEPPEAIIYDLRQQVEALGRTIHVAGLGGEPASAADLRWLLRRTYWRSLDMPLGEPSRISWGGEARELLEDGLVENHHSYLRVSQPLRGAEFYCSTLAVSRFPGQLPDVSGDWLALSDEMPFPVEWAVRFRVMERREATKAVEQQAHPVRDQYRHVAEMPEAPIPRALAEQRDQVEDVVHRIARRHERVVDLWPRLLVAAPTLPELRKRISHLADHFKDNLDIEIVAPTGDQLALFRELMPGSQLELRNSYRHPASLDTLAASGALAASHLGDGEGPYIGRTSVSGTPVMFDPHRTSRTNQPTLVGIFGRPGSGKSNLAYLLAYWERLRGASVAIVDPENVRTGFADLCRECGRVNEIRLDDPGLGNVSLDPYRLLPREAAPQLAATMLSTLLPQPLAGPVRMAIMAATSKAATLGHPSLGEAVQLLAREFAETQETKAAAETLRWVSGWEMARPMFSQQGSLDAELKNALTILKFRGLPIPDAGMPPERWTDEHRIATAIVYGMVALAGRVIDVGGPDHPKMVIYDDALPILSNSEGRATIEREVLRGRKMHATPVVISQNASHAMTQSSGGRQTLVSNMASAFVFRLPDREEAIEGCRVLGISPTDDNVHLLQTIGPDMEGDDLPTYAECVARIEGRVGRVQIDLVSREIRAAFSTTPFARLANAS
jgi:hypothetical protein